MSKYKETKGVFVVKASKDSTWFAIDHQSFTLHIMQENGSKTPPAERLKKNQWYAKMLRIALKRLAEHGKKKVHGAKVRTTKKPKANEAIKHR